MKILALEVEGFGIWSGLKLDGLADGLNVLFGPNEAGKTTLLQWLRAMLYGFSPQQRRYLPPLGGGQPGGSLRVLGDNGPIRIRRRLPKDNPDGPERLELSGGGRTASRQEDLAALLGGVDEVVFNNVFAIGLRELQQLGTLSDTEAASLLYQLSMGKDRVCLASVVREVNACREQLLARDGASGTIAELIEARDELRGRLKQLAERTGEYARAAAEYQQLKREAGRLDDLLKQLRHEAVVVEAARAVEERWRSRQALDERLASLEPVSDRAEAALAEWEALNRQLANEQATLDQLRSGWREIRRQLDALPLNQALWQWGPRIEVMVAQQPWLGRLRERIGQLEAEIARLEARLATVKKRFGIEDGPQAEAVQSLAPATLKRLREPARAVRQAEKRYKELQNQQEAARNTAEQLVGRIHEELGKRGEEELAAALDRASQAVAQLRRRLQMDERLQQMHQYREELERQSRALVGRRVLPVWMLLGLGGLFAFGVVLVLAAMFFRSLAGGYSAWALGIAGVTAMGAAVAAKYLLERMAARRLDSCQQQLQLLKGQITHAEQERDQVDKQAGWEPESLPARLQAAEQELKELEALVPVDARRRAAEQEAEAAEQQIAEAETRWAAARDRWRDLLTALGLPGQLSPAQVKRLVSRAGQISELTRRLKSAYEELEQRTAEWETCTAQLCEIVNQTGVGAECENAEEQIELLRKKLAEQETNRRRRQELRRQLQDIRRQAAERRKAIGRLRRRCQRILRRIKASDETELREQAARAQQARQWREQRDNLQQQIEAALAGRCEENEVAEKLARHSPEELFRLHEQLLGKIQTAEAQLQDHFERRGQLSHQLQRLAQDRTAAETRLQLAEIEARLEQTIDRWRTLAVTSCLLDSLRVRYEQQRQPATLREATRYFKRMTEGRYRRIWTPLEEDTLLVDTSDGRTLPVELLSQGTREQLFLALRLAMANTFAHRGTRLPLVLDDVLVNFDRRRAQAAAAVLCDYAKDGHQLLVFTCHEHIAAVFQSLGAPVIHLPDQKSEATPAAAQKSSRPGRKSTRPARKKKPKQAPPAETQPAGPAAHQTKALHASDEYPIQYADAANQADQPTESDWQLLHAPDAGGRSKLSPDTSSVAKASDNQTPTTSSAAAGSEEYELAPIEEDEIASPDSSEHTPGASPAPWEAADPHAQWLERYDDGTGAEAA